MTETALLGAVLLLTISLARTQQQPDYQHAAALDAHGRYVMRWSFDKTSITVEVAAQTRGYVGFGLSPNGAMASSDLIFGGIGDGKPYLHVRSKLSHVNVVWRRRATAHRCLT